MWAATIVLLTGCPAKEEPEPNTVVEAEAIDVDGFVLMRRDDGSSAAVNLIDPSTGEASPFEVPIVPFATSSSKPICYPNRTRTLLASSVTGEIIGRA